MSRYVMVEVRVSVLRSGRADVRVRMKPGAACWSDLDTVAALQLVGVPFPRSPEEAAEVATRALRDGYPGLF